MKISTDVKKPAANCDRESSRYAFGCAKLIPNCDGGWLISTNAKTLAVSHCEVDEFERSVIPADAFKCLKKKTNLTVEVSENVCVNSDGKGATLEASDSDYGRFPNVANVIPDVADNAFCVSLDVKLLRELADSLQTRDGGEDAVRIWINPKSVEWGKMDDSPVVVTVDGTENIGLQMPIGGGHSVNRYRESAQHLVSQVKSDWEKSNS